MAEHIARGGRRASTILKTLSNEDRTEALQLIYDALKANKNEILKANKLDLEEAEKANLSNSLVGRLNLAKGDKFDSMVQGVLDVAHLPDPIGRTTLATKIDDGLELSRVTCPVGVLLVIFESRPEVIANIASLALKSGNAAILKGGKESTHSFKAIASVINEALSKSKIPANGIQLVTTRDEINELLSQDKYIDLVIPRGSNDLVKFVQNNTKIAVLGHADGICSIYLRADAKPEMAERVIVDSKTNYAVGCNAVETLLVDQAALSDKAAFTAAITGLLEKNVKLKVTPEIRLAIGDKLLSKYPSLVVPATEQDFYTEFLEFTLAVKAVANLDDAIVHINEHGSHHTDCIITEDNAVAEKFLKGIDSASVYWNASTRFADGFRYGFGTEVGISTGKIHVRGPVGLEGLTTFQYNIRGHGQIAADYVGAGGSKQFKHESIDI
jgi:glutamate-5-semialdehyde dehydrogenase